MAFLALAALAVLSASIFANRLDTKQDLNHQAAVLALDSMEEARVLFEQDPDVDLTTSLTAGAFQLERTVKLVGDEVELPPEALLEVLVTVTWKDQQGDQSYRLLQRFYRP